MGKIVIEKRINIKTNEVKKILDSKLEIENSEIIKIRRDYFFYINLLGNIKYLNESNEVKIEIIKFPVIEKIKEYNNRRLKVELVDIKARSIDKNKYVFFSEITY